MQGNTAGQAEGENHRRGRVNCYLLLTSGYVRSQWAVVSVLIGSLIFAIIKE